MKQPHILCRAEDVAERVIMPGDPQRVLRVASYLDEWREVGYNREFRTITGTYKGMPITVTSTGIGGASAAIALEELIACGAKNFIRIGSAGAVQSNVGIGDMVIPTASVREDGASKMYISENYPAVADFELTSMIIDTCKKLQYVYSSGVIRSHDSFYIDDEKERMAFWNEKNVIASDMETATLFTLSQLRGVKAACILNNVVRYEGALKESIEEYVETGKEAEEGEKREIILALESFYRFYEKNK